MNRNSGSKTIRNPMADMEVIHGVDLDGASGEIRRLRRPPRAAENPRFLQIIRGAGGHTSGSPEKSTARRSTTSPAAERGPVEVFQSYALYPPYDRLKNTWRSGWRTARCPKAEHRRPASARRVSDANRSTATTSTARPKALVGRAKRRRVANRPRQSVREPRPSSFDETAVEPRCAELRVTMRKELAALHAKIGGTMIYVTTGQGGAMTLADRIVVLQKGPIGAGRQAAGALPPREPLLWAALIGSPA